MLAVATPSLTLDTTIIHKMYPKACTNTALQIQGEEMAAKRICADLSGDEAAERRGTSLQK